MSLALYLCGVLIANFFLMKGYFEAAKYFKIYDVPNNRSMHAEMTIRGGGIVFVLTALFFFCTSFQYPYFFAGLLGVSLISFLDDIFTIRNGSKLLIQFICTSLLLWQLSPELVHSLWVLPILVVVVGIINAFNFMDGINGITGLYSLVVLGTLAWVLLHWGLDQHLVQLSLVLCASVLVFLFFNFRRRALCFAGDIGSISMSFLVCFILGFVIYQTQRVHYILFLAVYGIDSIYTILIRIRKWENIFLPHKLHLFQLLVYKKQISPLWVSAWFAMVQCLFNIGLLSVEAYVEAHTLVFSLGLLMVLVLMYLKTRHFANASPTA